MIPVAVSYVLPCGDESTITVVRYGDATNVSLLKDECVTSALRIARNAELTVHPKDSKFHVDERTSA